MEDPVKFITEEEYLAYDLKSDYKSEYYDGQIMNMAGASEKHNTISVNIVSEMRVQLKKRLPGLCQ